jgi:hypothetical protein
MKIELLILFYWCLPLRAASVLLTVTGRVSETNAASFFPNAPVAAGDQWTAEMTWHYPTPGFQIIEISYDDPLGSLRFAVNGHSWDGAHLLGGLGGTSFNASLFATPPAPTGYSTPGSTSVVVLTWHGLVVADTDTSSLPQSFSDWNLPAAQSFDLEVRTEIGQPGSVWLIKANSWETMTILVIPEPGTAALAGLAALTALTRRRSASMKNFFAMLEGLPFAGSKAATVPRGSFDPTP